MESFTELRRAAKLFTLALLGVGLWLLFRFFPTLPLPFLLGLVIGGSIHVLAKKLSTSLHLPKKLCSILLLLLLLALLGFLIFLLGARLAKEVQELPDWLEENASGPTGIFHAVGEFFTRLGERFPVLGALRRLLPENMQGDLGESLSSLLTSLFSRFSSTLSAFLLRSVALAPGALISFFVTLLSCYYFATDGDVIVSGALHLLPERAQKRATELLPLLRSALRRYARTYLLLMLLTFAELMVGFMLLRIPYPILLALLISLVDVLPLFGAGTVLLPWALVSFLLGNPSLGSGLLILYGAMTVVRQLIEPRLLGKNLGIHPFATLFTMYVGLRLFGFAGLILSPVVAFVFKELRQSK